ncbi:type II toxin-antitoxin system VapC family toxin [Tetragenococcus koreensis]|uniref:PIN domain-containing protein n=1 Tax=Tetragenococcus koreensis TaxID=290335 RepID=A0AAN4RKX8_9ENTE|nr:PIN domain-containing protein [Tetragenococcus koreensis]MCF1616310.1 PIN domain-containing protein [Tetragenococcus koreensis]MCF1621223.1 PIN domain-containing protein [Tetragenococcus koreensis]MCF1626181.1 PIN domain-containing protein [Tetragenococcus koreensis]MCF1631217.1 PIN domain-containing protein [Tetragenococcus koreensis]MCF1677272.1 PIN domain-containing protein [Tetragenococcus koreensis]
MNCIIDINVILDVLVKREEFYKQSKEVYMLSVYGVIKGCITANMVTDIYYILEKYGSENTKNEIKKLLQLNEVLSVTELDCINALELSGDDFEDNLIIATAIRNDVESIITRNGEDYRNSGLIVYTPEELIRKFK